MVALREEWSQEQPSEQAPFPQDEGVRWLNLRHAACRLNVCTSTLRRRMRRGELPWRAVSRGRRWSYEVLVPDGASPCAVDGTAASMEAFLRRQMEEKEREVARLKCELERLEQRLDNLSQALARARSTGAPALNDSPYAKYREIVPRRRWWLF